jgi:hypothetical protein
MDHATPNRTITTTGDSVPPQGIAVAALRPTPAGQAALEAAQALA